MSSNEEVGARTLTQCASVRALRSVVGMRGVRVNYKVKRTHILHPMTSPPPSCCPSLRSKTFSKKRNDRVKQQLSAFLNNIQKLKYDITLLELELHTSRLKVSTTCCSMYYIRSIHCQTYTRCKTTLVR